MVKSLPKQSITLEKLDKNIEDLARITKTGFNEMRKEMKEEIGAVQDELRYANSRLTIIEYDIKELKNSFVYREEFEEALNRLELVEKKLGIRSSK